MPQVSQITILEFLFVCSDLQDRDQIPKMTKIQIKLIFYSMVFSIRVRVQVRPTDGKAKHKKLEPFNPETSAALLWGAPVPHAQYLRNQSPTYAQIDVFGDRLLNDATHAAHSRTQSNDYIAKFLADLATQYGIPTSVKNVPFAKSNSQRRADLVTCRGGLVRPNPNLSLTKARC